MLFMPLSYKRSVHCSEKAEDASSTLAGGTKCAISSVVEHRTFNAGVRSPILRWRTNKVAITFPRKQPQD